MTAAKGMSVVIAAGARARGDLDVPPPQRARVAPAASQRADVLAQDGEVGGESRPKVGVGYDGRTVLAPGDALGS